MDRGEPLALRPAATTLRLDRRRAATDARRKPAPLRRTGTAPHTTWREPERGWLLYLEVRQLRARLAALRHDTRGDCLVVVAHHLPDAPRLRQGKLGKEPSGRWPHR